MRMKWDLTQVKISHSAILDKYWLLLLLATVLATFHFSFLSLIISCSWLSWPVLVFSGLEFALWILDNLAFLVLILDGSCKEMPVALLLFRSFAQGATSTDHVCPRPCPQVSVLDWKLIYPGTPWVWGGERAEMGREWTKVSTFDNIPLSTVDGCLKCFVKLRFQLHPIFI